MPRTRLIVGAVALALAASSAHAQRFSRVVSFGDSLSDAGNIGLAPAQAGGLGGAFGPSQSFTTNPDPVMVELLGEENQGLPRLVVGDDWEGPEVERAKDRRFVGDSRPIMRYLAARYGSAPPHP